MTEGKRRRRIRWAVMVTFCTLLLLTGLAWRFLLSRQTASWQHLAQVVHFESAGIDERNVQLLGWSLAILGRDDEIRSLDFMPQFEPPPLKVELDKLKLKVIPWREGISQIAESHQIVMIMEDHFVSKHREMIGATLPIFRKAGFNHYAAEGIYESSSSLVARGFPGVSTGFYTSDPQFGNVLRRGSDLGFIITGYDFGRSSHEARELYAARVLAKLFQSNPETKLLVHAGFSHVLKHKTDIGQRWLASILWDKTGIEPFTIWQWSSMRDGHEHQVVADALVELGDFVEPVLLMPPPNTDCGLIDVPRVDAILVHPPDQSVAPAARSVLFPKEMQSVSGQWLTKQWPVVIAAYKEGEPTTAIPLDQVMMRDSERDFVLWIPASLNFKIVVFDQNGVLESNTVRHRNSVIVKMEE